MFTIPSLHARRMVSGEHPSASLRARHHHQRRSLRSGMEQLEDRTVLSSGAFFFSLGDYFPGSQRTGGVSDDGSTVVGGFTDPTTGQEEAFRFTIVDGPQGLGVAEPLGTLNGYTSSVASDVSADGSLVVGRYIGTSSVLSTIWRGPGDIITLPGLGGPAADTYTFSFGGAADITQLQDGTVAVVGSNMSPAGNEAFLWTDNDLSDATPGTIVGLGDLPGGKFKSFAKGISADGTTVVGWSYTDKFGHDDKGVRWTAQTGMLELGGGVDWAHDVSADGSVVVGVSYRWTQETGPIGLPLSAYTISADGSIIAGETGTPDGFRAAIWDEFSGMRLLEDVLTNDHGLDLAGFRPRMITDVSADGATFTGFGYAADGAQEVFVAYVPPASAQPGIVVSPTSGLVTSEGGTSDTFTVVLKTQPTDDVTVAVSSSNPGEGTVDASSVVFTPANWYIPRVVMVTGADDVVQDGDQPYTIQFAPAVSNDPDYNGLVAVDVSVTNQDNEAPPASPDDIYVWDIGMETRKRKGKNEGQIVVDIRNDWNTNGADSLDAAAANVLVTVTLTGPSGTTTYSGYTDSSGVFRTGWISGLAAGSYTVDVIDLVHATFDWNWLLDLEDDSDGDGNPDDIFALS